MEPRTMEPPTMEPRTMEPPEALPLLVRLVALQPRLDRTPQRMRQHTEGGGAGH